MIHFYAGFVRRPHGPKKSCFARRLVRIEYHMEACFIGSATRIIPVNVRICVHDTDAEGVEWIGFASMCILAVPHERAPILSHPPALFVALELGAMMPRAIRGHAWYKRRFRTYPKDRLAVIPFIA